MHIHLQGGPYARERLIAQHLLARDSQTLRKAHPKLGVTGVFAAEEVLAFFLNHVLQQRPAQFRHRTFLIAHAEESVDVAKLVKQILRPPLELFFRKSAREEQLPDRMRPAISGP